MCDVRAVVVASPVTNRPGHRPGRFCWLRRSAPHIATPHVPTIGVGEHKAIWIAGLKEIY